MGTIAYKGKTLATVWYNGVDMPQEIYKELVKQHYSKPDYKHELTQFLNKKSRKINNTLRYFFQDIMFDTVLYHSKWSVNTAFENISILTIFYNKVKAKPETFTGRDLYQKIMTAIRIGGKGIVAKPTNFKLNLAIDIVERFSNAGDNVLDTSCGWGVRMLSALYTHRNYFGIDPNPKLTNRLNSLYKISKEIKPNIPIIEIKTQGSEIFISEWKNKMDLAFTSYPYFILEDYIWGEQSIKQFTTYESWLLGFLLPTLENTYKYLKHGKYLVGNIKSFDKYDLEHDFLELAYQVGFEYVDTYSIKAATRISRAKGKKVSHKIHEPIFIFRKPTK